MPVYDLRLHVELTAWYSVHADTVEGAVAAANDLSLYEVTTDDSNAQWTIDEITTEGDDGLEHAVDFAVPGPDREAG